MVGVFELFHLSLHTKKQSELFSQRVITREEWLREVFSSGFKFKTKKNEIHWVPEKIDGVLITGRLIKNHARRRNRPPEEGAVEEIVDEWQGSIFVLDPTKHSNGQKVAFERDNTLGKFVSVMNRLAEYLNSLENSPFIVEPKPIFNKESFWKWAETYDFRLKKINFEFITPNMFDVKSDFDKEMEEFGQYGVSRVAMSMTDGNRGSGIDARGKQIENAVEYAAQGGGKINAKSRNGEVFSSNNNIKTRKLPPNLEQVTGKIVEIVKYLKDILSDE